MAGTLQKRVADGRLVNRHKIHQAIGRLRERYGRVSRYYEITYESVGRALQWHEDVERKARARQLDGAYLLKTDRDDLSHEKIWRTYMLPTRAEAAFRAMESPLAERPICLGSQTGRAAMSRHAVEHVASPPRNRVKTTAHLPLACAQSGTGVRR